MQDIAVLAGVSVSTVSRYLNGTASVASDPSKKIKAAIESTGYEHKISANRISSGIMVMFLPDILNPVYMEIAKGAQDEAISQNDTLMLVSAMENTKQQQSMLRCMNKRDIVGIIILGWKLPLASSIMEVREKYGIPVVMIGRRLEQCDIPCILVDHEKAMYQGAKYLLELNHEKIAYLSAPTSWETSQAKLSGFNKAVSAFGIQTRQEFFAEGLPNIESGFQLTNRLLQRPPKELPTAIIAHNDLMAFGAIHSIRGHEMSVPKDISVMGYDDIAMATHSNPSLSTIATPKYRMGQTSVEVLRKASANNEVSSFTFLECPLIIRESTAPASS